MRNGTWFRAGFAGNIEGHDHYHRGGVACDPKARFREN